MNGIIIVSLLLGVVFIGVGGFIMVLDEKEQHYYIFLSLIVIIIGCVLLILIPIIWMVFIKI